MAPVRLQVVLFLLLVLNVAFCKDSYYKVLRKSLVNGDGNLEKLRRHFFMTDGPKRIVVDIDYKLNCSDEETSTSTLHFRWMLSYINLFVQPEILQPLSLYMFQTEIPTVQLMLNLPLDCIDILDYTEDCKDNDTTTVGILHDLTSGMQYYAMKSQDPSIKLADNLGFSVLMNNNNVSYCIPGQNYNALHWLLVVAVCVLMLLFSVGVPTILVGVHEKLKKKMADPDRDWRYIVWAVAIVAFFLTIIMIVANLVFLVIFWSHLLASRALVCYGFLVFASIIAVVLILSYMCAADDETLKFSDIDAPDILLKLFRGKCGKKFLIFLACLFFTLFLVFMTFHGFYMVLGVFASPVIVVFRICFVIASILCLVVFTAFFLKFSARSLCNQQEQQNNGQNRNRLFCVLIYAPPVISALLLLASVVILAAVYYYFSMMMDYRHNDDFLTILSSLLPSALLAIAALCGRKLMDCLKQKDDDEEKLDAKVHRALLRALQKIAPNDTNQQPPDVVNPRDADGGGGNGREGRDGGGGNRREGGDGGGGGDCCYGNGLLNCFTRREESESESLINDGQDRTRHQEQA